MWITTKVKISRMLYLKINGICRISLVYRTQLITYYLAAGSKLNCLYHIHIHLGEIREMEFC